ncbi:MAG: branched-chain amino acid ABC transporter permease [Rhodospirillales bacterium]|nr:branched-chain amino acid ABC transporter permease [Rhodospirillales bacterium]
MSEFVQFMFSGVTSGAIYALAALGFALIYNASNVINFAQGEFIMLGGMAAAFFNAHGVPLMLAVPLAIAVTAIAGLLVEKLAIEPAKNADVTTLIIITIGVSLVMRGLAQIFLGKNTRPLPSFSGDAPFSALGATILPQSLWILATTLATVAALAWYFGRTRAGKAMLATSYNRLAAQLVGVNTRAVLLASFGLAAALGALGGVLVAPITGASYDSGIMLGMKGFVAATLGGLGSGMGAVAGGLLLGIVEAMTAGYLSSSYKDALPFVLILLVLFFLPNGLFGAKTTERV